MRCVTFLSLMTCFITVTALEQMIKLMPALVQLGAQSSFTRR